MSMTRDAIPPGTLHLLILKTLARVEEMHGFEIAESIGRLSEDVLTVEEGSLYPALQRMLVKGWVAAEWGSTAGNRRARYYRLTRAGRRQLEAELSQFERVTGAIVRVLQAG
jgi:PadR family transcriptional regulator, regulatory protein PadR